MFSFVEKVKFRLTICSGNSFGTKVGCWMCPLGDTRAARAFNLDDGDDDDDDDDDDDGDAGDGGGGGVHRVTPGLTMHLTLAIMMVVVAMVVKVMFMMMVVFFLK